MEAWEGSRKGCFADCTEVSEVYSERQFFRRTSSAKLGIGKARQRTDVCDYCHHYDHAIGKEFGGVWHECVRRFDKASKGFSARWDARVVRTAAWNRAALVRAFSPSHVAALADYIDAGTIGRPGLKAERDWALPMFRGDDGYVSHVNAFSSHLSLRDNQLAMYSKHVHEPCEGVLYCHWDQQE